MDYPLCDSTVTVFRMQGLQIRRQVIHGCYFQMEEQLVTDLHGKRENRRFLLVVPGDTQLVFPGDRVILGEYPMVPRSQWMEFVPALVPGLVQVEWVKSYSFGGKHCHTEAGSE
jgi:hypothetical protein